MRSHLAVTLIACLLPAALAAQAPFPAGLDGELYFAPRIDLVPAAEGGPYTVTLDGRLNDPVWQRAAFHTVNTVLDSAQPLDLDPPTDDWDMIFACAADHDFLYVAWKIVDDTLISHEQTYCDVWQDDSIEIYIDANNDGPNCTSGTASCYAVDDAQFTVGVDQVGRAPGDPEQPTCPEDTPVEECLEIGGVAGKGSCDFAGAPWPELMRGVVVELETGDIANNTFGEGKIGWQGEVAIALETIGNGDTGDPAWTIDPAVGGCIGFSVQGNDDDGPTIDSRDHKLAWAKREIAESAWRNPGVFGKLTFYDPTKPATQGACALPVEQLTCKRNADGSVLVTWKNPGTANPAVETQVFVDDVLKTTVPGDATQATLAAADVPEDGVDKLISVKNNSDEIPPVCVLVQNSFTDCGGIRFWNMLGSYETQLGAAPIEDDIRKDWLTDGVTGETDFVWKAGAQIHTDFQGASPAIRIRNGFGQPPKNPGGVPTVFEWRDVDSRVNFRDVFFVDYNDAMAYAQCYVNNTTGEEMEVYLGISSDDSVQVLLNGNEVWIHSIGRAGSDACAPQDISPDGLLFTDPHILDPGENSLMLKIFDGTGDWEFSVRFQNEIGEPIIEGLEISLTPSDTVRENCTNGTDDDGDQQIDCADSDCASEPTCQKPSFHRGDADENGELQLTDAIRILGVLFLGQGTIPCLDASDADDNGELQLTDAIRILGVLFLGQGTIPAPGPTTDPCGQDPTDDALDCGTYTRC